MKFTTVSLALIVAFTVTSALAQSRVEVRADYRIDEQDSVGFGSTNLAPMFSIPSECLHGRHAQLGSCTGPVNPVTIFFT